MPRLQAKFSEITTGFPKAPSGDYELLLVEDVTYAKTKGGDKNQYKFVWQIDDSDHPELSKVRIFDNVVMELNNGELNEISVGRLKDYYIAVNGVEPDDDEGFAPEEEFRKGVRVHAQVSLNDWESKEKKSDGTPLKKGQSNDIDRVFPIAR